MEQLAADLQTVHILEAIATAESVKECRYALELAVLALDHHNTRYHDAAASGIALLTRCYQRDAKTADGTLHSLYLRAIRMLLRCSDEKAVAAMCHIGSDLLLFVLALGCETIHDAGTKTAITALIDRLSELNVSLTDLQKSESLLRSLQRIARQGDGSFQACIAAQILGGWTKHPGSKRYVLDQPGLVEDVLAIGWDQSRAVPNDPALAHLDFPLHVANLLRQLAWNASSKLELLSKAGFLSTLGRLLSGNARDIALDVLRQLCTEATCRVAVCKHENGSILRSFLATDDPSLNDAANHTILRLVTQDTAPILLKNEPCLIERLEHTAGSVNADNESSILAAHALKRVAAYVSVSDSAYPQLLDALTVLSSAQNWRIRSWAVQGLQEQSKTSSGRFYMARTSNAMGTLVRIAIAEPIDSVKAIATETLLTMALDTANAKRLASNSEVLEAFAQIATKALQTSSELQPAARMSIQAILSLACHKTTNKHRVAKTLGLVEALSRFGVSQGTDDELKRAALHCVIVLAPFM